MMAAMRQSDGWRLQALLEGWAPVPPEGDREVHGLTLDSRRVRDGDLFLACAGGRDHGERYLEHAIVNGAAAVARETDGAPAEIEYREHQGRTVPVVPVPGLRGHAGELAARFFGEPSRALHTVGVTGTNGKTSITQFAARALAAGGRPCGVIGSLGAGLVGELRDLGHTTPDAVRLQEELAGFRDAGAAWAVMEVSSHALDQGRTGGVAFDTAVFTNIGRDHLDYHGDLDAYAAAKRRLLDWPGLGHAVLNLDDPVLDRWWRELDGGPEAWGYSLRTPRPEDAGRSVLYAEGLHLDEQGLHFTVRGPEARGTVDTRLLGRFNVGNLLATLAVLLRAGVPWDEALGRLSALETVPGRMEPFHAPGRPLVVVDYAHSPDALEAVLAALREHAAGRLWCVFGCGGDRDRGKRPLMARAAERLADYVVVTDDNPRGEDPYDIIEAIVTGLENPDGAYVVRDRREAIERTVALAAPEDVVLVAGKGHESCQYIGDRCIPFNDRDEACRVLGGTHD